MGKERGVHVGTCMRPGGSRNRVRYCAVQAIAAAYSVFGLDAVALHHGFDLRRAYADVGVQRLAFDGALGMDRARWNREGHTPSVFRRHVGVGEIPEDRYRCVDTDAWGAATLRDRVRGYSG